MAVNYRLLTPSCSDSGLECAGGRQWPTLLFLPTLLGCRTYPHAGLIDASKHTAQGASARRYGHNEFAVVDFVMGRCLPGGAGRTLQGVVQLHGCAGATLAERQLVLAALRKLESEVASRIRGGLHQHLSARVFTTFHNNSTNWRAWNSKKAGGGKGKQGGERFNGVFHMRYVCSMDWPAVSDQLFLTLLFVLLICCSAVEGPVPGAGGVAFLPAVSFSLSDRGA